MAKIGLVKDKAGYWVVYKVRKRCPLCGGKATIDTFDEAIVYEPSWYYQGEKLACTDCGLSLREYCEDEYDREARAEVRKALLNQWNKRAQHA